MSYKQKKIAMLFTDHETVLKTSDIIRDCGLVYWCNSEKYIGEILSRMVKRGTLIRVRRGCYKLAPPGHVSQSGKSNVSEDDPNQLKLFEGDEKK